MIFLAWLRRLRIADRSGELVKAQPVQPLPRPLVGLPGAQVLVQSPDNTHYSARIVAQAFVGKRGIARHQLVYATLGELVGREIHALSIEAFTPDEWATRGA